MSTRVKFYSQEEVDNLQLPSRGRLVLSLTGKRSPEIPDFLQSQVTLYRDIVIRRDSKGRETIINGNAAMKTDLSVRLERLIVVGFPEFDLWIHEGELAVIEYRLLCVRSADGMAYYYAAKQLDGGVSAKSRK